MVLADTTKKKSLLAAALWKTTKNPTHVESFDQISTVALCPGHRNYSMSQFNKSPLAWVDVADLCESDGCLDIVRTIPLLHRVITDGRRAFTPCDWQGLYSFLSCCTVFVRSCILLLFLCLLCLIDYWGMDPLAFLYPYDRSCSAYCQMSAVLPIIRPHNSTSNNYEEECSLRLWHGGHF